MLEYDSAVAGTNRSSNLTHPIRQGPFINSVTRDGGGEGTFFQKVSVTVKISEKLSVTVTLKLREIASANAVYHDLYSALWMRPLQL